MASQENSVKHIEKSSTDPSQIHQKTAEGGTLQNSFYRAPITLIPKPEKDITKKKIIDQ